MDVIVQTVIDNSDKFMGLFIRLKFIEAGDAPHRLKDRRAG
jgi:hypothetical protein